MFFSRDRTEELRDTSTDGRRSSDDFGPTRIPAGYQRASSPSSPQTGRSYETNNPFTGNGRANSPPPAVPRHADTYEMQQQPQHESYAVKDLKDTNLYLQEVQRLRTEITRVSDLIDNIERIHASQLVSINSEQWDQLSHELERLQGETRKCNAEIKKSLEDLEKSNVSVPNNEDGQLRKNQSDTIRQRFIEVIRRYHNVESEYRTKFRQRVERQIRIVKPEATQQEVDDYLETSNDLFSQSLLQAGRQTHARTVLSEVQSRHNDIKRIERTIIELNQLFDDLQTLVSQQGEVVVQIGDNAETAAQDLKQGTRFAQRAIDSARSARAKKICCLILVIILLVVIAILVWWFAFDHKGVGDNP
ncbi:hypothetical protein VTP01DRAFT_1874 [Rhizomucor pusillus]|uniref:uncharacterized protein n=1 Tax=Rhizomucor pusillus TaxID=4840 RepID=UPI00374336FC